MPSPQQCLRVLIPHICTNTTWWQIFWLLPVWLSTEWYFMVAVIWIFILWVRFCIFHICLYAYLNFLFHAWSVHIFSHFSIVLFLSFYWLIRIYWKRVAGGGFPFSMLYISKWKDIGKCKSCPLSDPLPPHSLQLWGREVNYLIGKFGRRKWTGLASLFLLFGICLQNTGAPGGPWLCSQLSNRGPALARWGLQVSTAACDLGADMLHPRVWH